MAKKFPDSVLPRLPVHLALTLTYMKATNLAFGLIMDFAEPALRIKRAGREG